MKNIIEFYTDIIESFKLVVTEDGFLYRKSEEDGKKTMMTHNLKPVVLPTKDHIESMLVEDENGEIQVSKILFNPLNESAIKGNSDSLNICKNYAERILGHSLCGVGYLLMVLARHKEHQTKTSLEINKFLKRVHEADNQGVKEIIDDEMLSKWVKLYSKTITPTRSMVTFYLNKVHRIDGVKYNRSTTLHSEVYTELLKATKDTPIYDIKLRNKDLTIFKIIFEYIIPDFKEKEKTELGSNDTKRPAFISLMKLYHQIMSRINSIASSIQNVDESTFDSTYIDLRFKEEELDNLDIYTNELLSIPDDVDINRQMTKQNNATIPSLDTDVLNRNVEKPDFPVMAETPSVIQNVQTVSKPVEQTVQVQTPIQTQPVQSVPYNQALPIQPQAPRQELSPNQALSQMLDRMNPGYDIVPQMTMVPVQQPMMQNNYQTPLQTVNSPMPQMMAQTVQMGPYTGPMNGGFNSPYTQQPQQAPLQGVNTMGFGYNNPNAPQITYPYSY